MTDRPAGASAFPRWLRSSAVSGLRRLAAPLGSIVRISTPERAVALTFDDGPDPVVTPKLLAVLDAAGAHATFFVLLTRVHRHGTLIDEVTAAGHEIALHGPDHRRLTTMPPKTVLRRTEEARRELEDRVGTAITWFRPPYGAQTVSRYLAVRRAGLDVVLWGPSLWDWRDADEPDRLQRALHGVEPGAIVLGHDGLAAAEDGEVNPTTPSLDRAEWARRMIGEYAARGFRPETVGRLAGEGTVVRRGYFAR